MQNLKLYGLHRSGTNLAAYLLRNNFAVELLNDSKHFGWKHGRMPADAWTKDAKFVLCVRHPLAQAYANYRYYQRSWDFDSTMPGLFRPDTTFSEFLDQPIYEFPNPLVRFNCMCHHWIDCLPVDRRIIVRQEDQLTHQQWTLEQMQRKLQLERTGEQWITTTEHVDVGEKPRGFAEEPIDFMSAYTPDLLDFYKERIDQKLLERFGYPLIPASPVGSIVKEPWAKDIPQKISFILITNGQRAELTRQCIASIKANCQNVAAEIIVVGAVNGFIGGGLMKLVRANDAAEKGLLGAMRNAGAAVATGDTLVFLDDDILLPELWVSQFISYCQHHAWSLMGVRLMGPDGQRQYEPRSFVTGGFAIVRRSLFDRIKWSDEIQFHSIRNGIGDNEDCDFTRRVRQSGFTIAFDTINYVWHIQGGDTYCPSLERRIAEIS